MPTHSFTSLQTRLATAPQSWLVTGAGGFIGSHLVEALLKLGQSVTGLDNFATGKRPNLEDVRNQVTPEQWSRFTFIEGDIAELEICRSACAGAMRVLHQAALGSVPFSMENPAASHRANVTGTLNMLLAARDAGVRRFVYASSSAVYGDEPTLPKMEERTGALLSPYAATKWMDELYASVFARAYGFNTIGLRYFNVFGARQDPNGAYAAVIPKWIAAMLAGETVFINGDGETSRDFCYIDNVVQANLLAAMSEDAGANNQAYNVAAGQRTTLNQLFDLLQAGLRRREPALPETKPEYRDFRAGDVRQSLADITKAKHLLGYQPSHEVREGLELAMDWYVRTLKPARSIQGRL
jgi:UDP-N-acetylglucosamine/UDP-N-acetylgalactosamine 4-epimerase